MEIMDQAVKSLEKIDHTVCLAFNENNSAIFGKDKYESIDCKDFYEFAECYGTVERALVFAKRILNLLKRKKVDIRIFAHITKDWSSAQEGRGDELQLEMYNGCVLPQNKLTRAEFDVIKGWLKND